MGRRLLVLMLGALLAGCAAAPTTPPARVVYGYAWTESNQETNRVECVQVILANAPKDATTEQLNLWMYKCMSARGQGI